MRVARVPSALGPLRWARSHGDRQPHLSRELEAQGDGYALPALETRRNPRQHHVQSARLEPDRCSGGNLDRSGMAHLHDPVLDHASVEHRAAGAFRVGPDEMVRRIAVVGDAEVDRRHRRRADGCARPGIRHGKRFSSSRGRNGCETPGEDRRPKPHAPPEGQCRGSPGGRAVRAGAPFATRRRGTSAPGPGRAEPPRTTSRLPSATLSAHDVRSMTQIERPVPKHEPDGGRRTDCGYHRLGRVGNGNDHAVGEERPVHEAHRLVLGQ